MAGDLLVTTVEVLGMWVDSVWLQTWIKRPVVVTTSNMSLNWNANQTGKSSSGGWGTDIPRMLFTGYSATKKIMKIMNIVLENIPIRYEMS